MTAHDSHRWLHDLKATAGMRCRYNQQLTWRWGWTNRAARILMLALAVASVAALATDLAAVVACLTVVAALALNVLPLGEHVQHHYSLFKQWSTFRRDVERLKARTLDLADGGAVPARYIERWHELAADRCRLDALDPVSWPDLADRCREDEAEATWGRGIRTPAQVAQERLKRKPACMAQAGL